MEDKIREYVDKGRCIQCGGHSIVFSHAEYAYYVKTGLCAVCQQKEEAAFEAIEDEFQKYLDAGGRFTRDGEPL